MKTIFKIFGIFLLGLALTPAEAYAGRDVSSPYVTKGKIKLKSKTEYVIDDDSSVDGEWDQTFEVGYGVTDYLYLEPSITFADKPKKETETKNIGLEAKVQLTEKGEYWVDAGLKGEFKYSTTGDADTLKGEILLAKDIGKTSNAANIELTTEVGDDSSDREKFSVSWQTKYKISDVYSVGFEYYGNFKDTTYEYEDQEHLLGPVAYGKIGKSFGYEAGVLAGLSHKSPDATLKLNLSYKF